MTADSNDNLEDFIYRRIQYCIEHNPEFSIEQMQDEIYRSSVEKFGENGYAKKKEGYLPSKSFERYMDELKTPKKFQKTSEKIRKTCREL